MVVVAAVSWGVVSRYITEQPAAWAGEIAGIAFAWLVFFGAAAGFRHGAHVSIDLFVRGLPAAWRRAAALLADVLVLAFLVVLSVLAFEFNLDAWTDPTSVLRLPRTVFYAPVLLGSLCMLARQGSTTMHRLRGISPDPVAP